MLVNVQSIQRHQNLGQGIWFEKCLQFICENRCPKPTLQKIKLLYNKIIKNCPHLSCDLHKLGGNLYSKLLVAPFSCKKVGHCKEGKTGGWVEGWMDGW